MKRTHPQSVAEIISNLLRKENLEQQWDEHRVLNIWPEIVGPGINRYTVNRTISNGISRSLLAKRINQAVGKDIIRDIIFR